LKKSQGRVLRTALKKGGKHIKMPQDTAKSGKGGSMAGYEPGKHVDVHLGKKK